MTKTFALLLDSYRELNAKRLFWVVLAISALVVGLFAAVGVTAGSLTLFGQPLFRSPWLSLFTPAALYNYLFVALGVKFWLSWIAAILALVSTAGVFPDLMAGGSIDLYLSKSLSRLWLFGTKVAGALLFVALQVTVFCLCSFLVLRFRGGTWQPGVFVAVPLVVLMFSYLFAVCVLLGVLTRSTIAALLLTILFWAVIATMQGLERLATTGEAMYAQRIASLDRQIANDEAELKAMPATPATTVAAAATSRPSSSRGGSWFGNLFGGGRPTRSRQQVEMGLLSLRDERQQMPPDPLATPHAVLSGILAPLPKTAGTIEVLERQLLALTDLPPVADSSDTDDDAFGPPDQGPGGRRRGGGRRRDEYVDRQVDIQLRQRSATYILGTSLAFEAVVLALAAWVFCRRDY